MLNEVRVAISGKSGCGNTTVSRLVAQDLGLRVGLGTGLRIVLHLLRELFHGRARRMQLLLQHLDLPLLGLDERAQIVGFRRLRMRRRNRGQNHRRQYLLHVFLPMKGWMARILMRIIPIGKSFSLLFDPDQ